MTTFSIIINTLNRAKFLRNTLQSLHYLRHEAFEVIVVNGPSTDETAEIIAENAGAIIAAECPEPNLSMSRNIGIARARGDVVCFIDDDAIPEPDWLDELETHYSDRQVGAVGGFTRDHTGVTFQARALVCDEFGGSKNFDRVEDALQFLEENERFYFSQTGTNSSFRRSALLQVGGFDEHYAYFLDETDVNLRIVQAGYKVVYAPTAEVHHKYAPSHLRNERRVPTSLFKPASSKAYFAVRNAMPKRSLFEILEHLGVYEADIRGHNRWYLENGVIDHDAHLQLDHSLAEGIRHGLTTALKESKRKLLQGCAADPLPNHAIKSFSAKLPQNERLRICFLSQEYPPLECGGIGVWTATVAKSFARLGHEVSVVTRDTQAGQNTVDFEDGVWVHRICPAWHPTRTVPPLPDLPQIIKDYCYTALDEVLRIRERRGLDVVSAPIWDLEGAAILRDGTIPCVLSLHTTFKLALPSKPDWINNGSYRREHVDKIIGGEAVFLGEAPHILANSNAILQDIEKLYALSIEEERRVVIPHGIDDIAARQSRLARELGGKVKVLFVGRFEPRKGIPELLTAIEELMQAGCEVEFTLAGDNTIDVDGVNFWSDFGKKHRSSAWFRQVHAPGKVSRDELWRLFADCDVFVGPSRYESFGLIFVEAMMFGKPCIGTTAGGIPEVIEDGVTGLLVPPNDPSQLKNALFRLVNDSALRNQMGLASRLSFEKNFSSVAMTRLLLNFYSEVSARNLSVPKTAA